ncbi:hypothetical protein [Candidatus Oscillochloris fontis]|uniref:hypothetical protein n=1 Tax=Candidatus Oscillochloris fontis TaxID=2496868 RepID=UPI00101D38C5|nr:hypothetical protein [Candidatus Oscillochloris fontis]
MAIVVPSESVPSAMPEIIPTQINPTVDGVEGVATATPAPTAEIVLPSPTATIPPPFILSTRAPQSNEERWREQQINRIVFEPMRIYTTARSELWWYDPINQQHVLLGTFMGDFSAQAAFTLRDKNLDALEVPYNVNKSYGLTALSPALIARINAAGGSEWIETYVVITPDLVGR